MRLSTSGDRRETNRLSTRLPNPFLLKLPGVLRVTILLLPSNCEVKSILLSSCMPGNRKGLRTASYTDSFKDNLRKDEIPGFTATRISGVVSSANHSANCFGLIVVASFRLINFFMVNVTMRLAETQFKFNKVIHKIKMVVIIF